jgi:hypothetical protein
MQAVMEHHRQLDQEVVLAAVVQDHLVQMEHHLVAEMAEMELPRHILEQQ